MQRNVAFVDLAFSSALRRRGIGTLLAGDIPSSVYEEAPLARAVEHQAMAAELDRLRRQARPSQQTPTGGMYLVLSSSD